MNKTYKTVAVAHNIYNVTTLFTINVTEGKGTLFHPPNAIAIDRIIMSSVQNNITYTLSSFDNSRNFDSVTYLFDRYFNRGAMYFNSLGSYNSAGTYTGSATTSGIFLPQGIVSIPGAWFQIDISFTQISNSKTKMNGYALRGGGFGAWYLLGSQNQGINWFLVDSQSQNWTNEGMTPFMFNATAYYTSYRFIANKSDGSSTPYVSQFVLLWSTETPARVPTLFDYYPNPYNPGTTPPNGSGTNDNGGGTSSGGSVGVTPTLSGTPFKGFIFNAGVDGLVTSQPLSNHFWYATFVEISSSVGLGDAPIPQQRYKMSDTFTYHSPYHYGITSLNNYKYNIHFKACNDYGGYVEQTITISQYA
jgi:hypothetical protein